MTGAEYLVNLLTEYGVKNAFGVPGGVILDFLYALKQSKTIKPVLCYHEQGAGFAAIGYAQSSAQLGVAYATRGPGFTNFVTPIADAFQDSVPVVFITAHETDKIDYSVRVVASQEIDTTPIVSTITKYACRIDNASDFIRCCNLACSIAMTGRKGPVLLDIKSSLFCSEVLNFENTIKDMLTETDSSCIADLQKILSESHRPIFLIGTGVQSSKLANKIVKIAEINRIPILSSRTAQGLCKSSINYGYIGSHGVRYSNFIFSKTDLIIALGNSMSFPVNSQSFLPVISKAKIIQFDIDGENLKIRSADWQIFKSDLDDIIQKIENKKMAYKNSKKWLDVCDKLRDELKECDKSVIVNNIATIFEVFSNACTSVVDIGNCEFWVSRAYEYVRPNLDIIYSKHYGTLGSGLSKSIGIYCHTGRKVLCFVGDQGVQFNIQELQTIADNKMNIVIVILNNECSGMIKDRQTKKYDSDYVHTTKDSGYGTPNFKLLAKAYGLEYILFDDIEKLKMLKQDNKPVIIEVKVDMEIELTPYLPKGNPCQKLEPHIPVEQYNKLDEL